MTEAEKKAYEAQENYCKENGIFFFAYDRCPNCGKKVFGEGGVTLQTASNTLVTGCPWCHYSFCE